MDELPASVTAGVVRLSRTLEEVVDPFCPTGDARRRMWGYTHEDYSGRRRDVLVENIAFHNLGSGYVHATPISYPRDARANWQGGPVRGRWRPRLFTLTHELSGGGSQMEIDWRYASAGPDFAGYKDANARARELLLEHLNPQQRLTFLRRQRFFVQGELNQLYAIELGNGVSIVDPTTLEIRVSLCYHPDTFMPYEDTMLATKLLIESGLDGERVMLETARARRHPRSRVEPTPAMREAAAMERELLAA